MSLSDTKTATKDQVELNGLSASEKTSRRLRVHEIAISGTFRTQVTMISDCEFQPGGAD